MNLVVGKTLLPFRTTEYIETFTLWVLVLHNSFTHSCFNVGKDCTHDPLNFVSLFSLKFLKLQKK